MAEGIKEKHKDALLNKLKVIFIGACIMVFERKIYYTIETRLHSAVSNVSGNICEFDCRSRGREFDHSPVPYFRGD